MLAERGFDWRTACAGELAHRRTVALAAGLLPAEELEGEREGRDAPDDEERELWRDRGERRASSITPRSASFSAVRGKAWTKG